MVYAEGRSPDRHYVLVVFDVSCDRRRRRLVKVLSGFGCRTQYSAFECLVRPGDEQRLMALASRHIEPAEDRLALYRLCGACRPRIAWLGEPLGRVLDEGVFFA